MREGREGAREGGREEEAGGREGLPPAQIPVLYTQGVCVSVHVD